MLNLIGLILLGVGGIAALVFGIMILVEAFKESILWGLGSLFVPFVMLIFVFMHWERTKTNFIRWAIAFVVYLIGLGMIAASNNA